MHPTLFAVSKISSNAIPTVEEGGVPLDSQYSKTTVKTLVSSVHRYFSYILITFVVATNTNSLPNDLPIISFAYCMLTS